MTPDVGLAIVTLSVRALMLIVLTACVLVAYRGVRDLLTTRYSDLGLTDEPALDDAREVDR